MPTSVLKVPISDAEISLPFSIPYLEISVRLVQFGVLYVNTYEMTVVDELAVNLVFALYLFLPLT